MPPNAYRRNTRELDALTLAKPKPGNVLRHSVEKRQQRVLNLKVFIAWTILIPLIAVTFSTLVEVFFRALTRTAFWQSEQFIFFCLGGVAWGCAYWAGCRPIHAYVVGHELSHLIMARAFGGKIFAWSARPDGGFVETNKTNTWITLAPYLIPFYSISVVLLFGLVGLFLDLRAVQSIAGVRLEPVWFFYMALGFTWFFHVTYTLKTISIKQSDLDRNGEFFSVFIIFFVNVLLITLLYLAASPSPTHEMVELGRCWVGTLRFILGFLRQVLG
jgi:hypothetical protein